MTVQSKCIQAVTRQIINILISRFFCCKELLEQFPQKIVVPIKLVSEGLGKRWRTNSLVKTNRICIFNNSQFLKKKLREILFLFITFIIPSPITFKYFSADKPRCSTDAVKI